MTVKQLEQRLDKVERELEDLKRHVGKRSDAPWWEQVRGMFRDDPGYAEMARLGRKIRLAERKR